MRQLRDSIEVHLFSILYILFLSFGMLVVVFQTATYHMDFFALSGREQFMVCFGVAGAWSLQMATLMQRTAKKVLSGKSIVDEDNTAFLERTNQKFDQTVQQPKQP